jgi:hypothetical protein
MTDWSQRKATGKTRSYMTGILCFNRARINDVSLQVSNARKRNQFMMVHGISHIEFWDPGRANFVFICYKVLLRFPSEVTYLAASLLSKVIQLNCLFMEKISSACAEVRRQFINT